jgi:hypothetical protein
MACRFAIRCTPIDSRQPLRHRCDRQGHAQDQHVEEGRQSAHVLDDDDRRDHHERDRDDHQSQALPDPIELVLERRRAALDV